MTLPLKPEVLGQLLLMQSIIGSLPNEQTIFDFISKGLLDIPGIASAECIESTHSTDRAQTAQTISFPIIVENSPNRQLLLTLSDAEAFSPYTEYINNFCFMLSVLLEERNLRRINESHKKNLERRVAERTSELEKEIGERKKAEEALYESEKLFRTTFEYAVIGICVTSPDGTIRKVNGAFSKILGYPPAEIAGRKISDFTHADDLELSYTHIQALLEKKYDSATFEKRYIHSSGSVIWTTVGTFLFRNRHDIPQFFITHIEDITAQKSAEAEKEKLEEQLRQAHKMEAIGTLAGGIAHDFNNILAAIIGYTELAEEDLDRQNPARQSLDQVQKAAARAKELVQQILIFSRKQEQKLSPLNIRAVVAESITLLRATIPTTIAIEKELDHHCGTIMANSSHIHQILINLCTNSAQAMEENGGTLLVTLKNIDIDRKRKTIDDDNTAGAHVVLMVRDTGPGIKADQIDRIFDPYYTTKDVGKGSGMGLSVVLGLVKSHNGVIQVESEEGRGTTFKVYFPRIDTIAEERVEEKQALTYGNERILVVDDEDAIVKILQRSISRLGYQVTAINTSKLALEILQANPDSFDLLITDQTMPHLTGEMLCRKLRAADITIPIIMCTGYSEKIDADKARTLGIKRFLLKPVARNELSTAIRAVLDG